MNATDLATDETKVAYIQSEVRAAEARLRARHPWLRFQDTIGAVILLGAWLGMAGCGWLFLEGLLPAWVVIPMAAIFASLTHELEHDLIHWLYGRRRPMLHHAMMALVWLARPSTVNPWIRRHLHFNHHKHSGTAVDIEERAITNGERWGLVRLLMTADAGVSVLVRVWRAQDWRSRWRPIWRSALAYFPLGWIHWSLWWSWLAIHALITIDAPIVWSSTFANWWPWHGLLIVIWVAPNVLRSFCLHLVSSNMHYYGDIEPGNLLQQCQVLRSRWWWPAQLFCFNFGGTHAIHHFVVGQPFYIRQWIAHEGQAAMRQAGVRFDDAASMARANRWSAV